VRQATDAVVDRAYGDPAVAEDQPRTTSRDAPRRDPGQADARPVRGLDDRAFIEFRREICQQVEPGGRADRLELGQVRGQRREQGVPPAPVERAATGGGKKEGAAEGKDSVGVKM
jgi:hypothetical protein